LRDHKHYVPADGNFTNNWYGITDIEGRDGTSAEGGGWGKVMTSSNPIAPTGSSTSASAHNNLPPYYALFYIIKVKK
jgi:microcystin-dependent protein